MTELAAPQISSLMEALPGIAAVLRSPVASAMVDLVRAGAGIGEFRYSDATELLQFGVRRNLLEEREVEALLLEVEAAVGKPSPPVKAKPIPKPPAPVAPLTVAKPAVYGKAVAKPPVTPAKVVAKPPVKALAKPASKAAVAQVPTVAKKSSAKGKPAPVVAKKKASAPPPKHKGKVVAKPATSKVAKKAPPKKAPAKKAPAKVSKGKAAAKKRR